MRTKETKPGKYYTRTTGAVFLRTSEEDSFVHLGTGNVLYSPNKNRNDWTECDRDGNPVKPEPQVGQVWRDTDGEEGRLGVTLSNDGTPIYTWLGYNDNGQYESPNLSDFIEDMTFVREPTDDELRILREAIG
jgi:hypothetical protein